MLRIQVKAQCIEPLERLQEFASTCEGLPFLEKQTPHGGKLAIVGGGMSTEKRLEELREWDGEIWAINKTAAWLAKHGIKSKMITVDPGTWEKFDTEGVEEAMLATCCHPELKTRFKKVGLFDLYETNPDGITGGTTTASRALSLGVYLGYFDITLFGCEGSYDIGKSHVDRDRADKEIVILRAGGQEFATNLEYMQQSEHLANMVTLAPNVFKQRCGGLLEAMINDPEWQVVAVSAALKEHLEAVNGSQGLFESSFSVDHLTHEAFHEDSFPDLRTLANH